MLGPNVETHLKASLKKLAAALGVGGDPAAMHRAEMLPGNTLKHIVHLALGAPGSTHYHEAMHGLLRELDNMGDVGREMKRVLHQLAGTKWMQQQLREFLKNDPAALKQLDDAEEAVAYMFEAWKADPSFRLRPKAETIFQRIADWIAKTAGYLRNDERALLLLQKFDEGFIAQHLKQPGTLRKELLNVGRGTPVIKALDELTAGLRDATMRVTRSGVGWLKETDLPGFNAIADAMYTEVGSEEGQKLSYLQAVERTHGQLTNKLFTALHGQDVDVLDEARRYLQADPASRPALSSLSQGAQKIATAWKRDVANYVRAQFDKAGIPLGNLGDDYFPVVLDAAKIDANRDGFAALLRADGMDEQAIRATIDQIVAGDVVTLDHDLSVPAFKSRNRRELTRSIDKAALAPFLNEDLPGMMLAYVRQASRKLEFSKRFGVQGERLDAALNAARDQGATEAELAQARQLVDGMLGNQAAIDPRWQKLNGWAIAAANVGLLGLSLLNSLIDPLGLAVRSGDFKEAWAGYQRGFKDMKKWVKEDPALFNDDDRLAMLFGTVAVAESAVSAISDVHTGGAKKLNDALFKYNGVEGWTRSQRVQATLGAFQFIERHLGKQDETSQRYMRELNLSAQDVQRTADGHIIRDPDNEKLTDAVHRYVDSVVLRPNRAMRPAWGNDPHFAALWHLKSFSYAFDKVFNERALYEAGQGNFTPVKVLASFAPVAMASYWLKLMISGGGELPNYAKAWDALDWMQMGLARAGYSGVSGLWTSAVMDPVYAAGPIVNMTADALGGEKG